MSDTNPAVSWDDEDDDNFSVNPPSVTELSAFDSDSLLGDEGNFDSNSIVAVAPVGDNETGEKITVVQLDSEGNEVRVTIDLALPPLNEDEAREITERIKTTTNVLYVLIKRAHAGKAWQALGYTSFEAYVKDEFDYSRSYAYKLLNQAHVINEISKAAPEGTEVYVGELTARGLKKSLPELIEKIEERTAGSDPEEASAIIEDIIRETKERKDEEDNFDEDFDDFNPGDHQNPSSAFDFIDDDDDDLDDFLGGDNDPTAVVAKLENLYTLLTGLQNVNDLSDKDNLNDLLPLIPTDRRAEVTRLVSVNAAWGKKLFTAWEEFLKENAVSNTEDDSEENIEEN